MTAEDGAAALAAWWVRCYTARVGTEAAEGRRAEIASDVWEQRAHARDVDAPPSAVALSIAWRVVGGVPADLVWSRQQRVVSRGRPPGREALSMSTMASVARHWWWVVVAVVVAAFFAWVALGNVSDPAGPYLGGTLFSIACAALIMAGAGLRPGRRELGDVLIAVGVAPVVIVSWFWPIQVAALVVLACALAELADLRAVRRPGRRTPLVVAVVVGTVLAVTAAGFSWLTVGGWPTAVLVAVAVVVLVALSSTLVLRRDADPVA